MKTIKIIIAAAAAALALVACSQEKVSSSDDTIQVCVSAKLPSTIITKSYGEGEEAKYLTYGVFEKNDDDCGSLVLSASKQDVFEGLSASFTVTLVKGQSYYFVFWADAEGSPYSTSDYRNFSVNYEAVSPNSEAGDAFCGWASIDVLSASNSSVSAELTRPFAQLNIGTNDLEASILEASGIDPSGLTYTVTLPAGLPQQIDVLTGEVSNYTEEAISIETTGYPETSDSNKFPVEGYSYLSYNYILAGYGEETSKAYEEALTFQISGSSI